MSPSLEVEVPTGPIEVAQAGSGHYEVLHAYRGASPAELLMRQMKRTQSGAGYGASGAQQPHRRPAVAQPRTGD